MERRRQLGHAWGGRLGAVLGLAAAGAALWVVAAPERSGETARAGVPQQTVVCSTFFEPEHPLELNTVVAGRFVKSIAMEKEVYRCIDVGSRIVRRLYDVELFVEIVEEARRGKVEPIEKRVELAVCAKDVAPQPSAPRITCRAGDVSLQPFDAPFAGCGLATAQPRDPVEMNTVVVQAGGLALPLPSGQPLVKTVKVEKEVFDCDGPVVDVFLFTEIVEARTRRGLGPIGKTFEAILCRKERATLEAAPRVRCMQLPVS